MRLQGVRLGAEPGALGRLGLVAVRASEGPERAVVGGVTLEAVTGEGVLGIDLVGAPADAPLPLVAVGAAADRSTSVHPVGATAVDHVVVLCGDVEGTIDALGTVPARLDERDGRCYGFVVVETSVLEFVGPAQPDDRPARLWGIALTVTDLDAAAASLGAACGDVKDAVQPGRRIATVRHDALGLRVPTVLLSPR